MTYKAALDELESGKTIVTGNNRLARTLRHAFDERQQQAGKTAWPSPDTLAWSAWLRRLWSESRLRGGQGRQWVLLDDVAADFVWQQSIRAVETGPEIQPLLHFARLGRTAWALLNDWDVLSAEEWTRPNLSPDQKAWLRWSGDYRTRCNNAGWIDAERLPVFLCSDIEAGLFSDLGPVCFAGFDEWTPRRQQLRDALSASGVAISTLGSKPGGQVLPALAPCESGYDELLQAARWARQVLTDSPGSTIGVVVPDLATRAEEVRRVFLDVFAPDWRVAGIPDELPLNVSYGRPLATLPVVHTALALLSAGQGRANFDAFSLLLRSRWLAGGQKESAARAHLDVVLREKLRVEFAIKEALPWCRKIAPGFAVILDTLLAVDVAHRRSSAAEWAHSLTELLRAVGWPGSDTLDSDTWQTLKAWNDLLARFGAHGVVLGKLSYAEFVSGLEQLAQQIMFQPEGTGEGTQIMGVLEAAGHHFDHLWICGMARESWPVAAKPNPFIPLELQRRVGMAKSSAAHMLAQAARQTDRLLTSADAIVASWPQQLEGEAQWPSPLLGAGMNNAKATAIVSVAKSPRWNEQLQALDATTLLEADPPPPWQGEERVRGGAGLLSLQARSPLNAFIEKRLGAFEMQVPGVGIDALQRGILTHKALEDLYKSAPSSAALGALSTDERSKRLRTSLQAGVAHLPGIREPFMRALAALEIEQQVTRMLVFIELDLQRPEFRDVKTEDTHDIRLGPVRLQLKLDRLDTLADGRHLVIDYKTGKVDRQSWNPDRPRDMQLPLYVTAVVPDADGVAFAQVSSQGIAFDGVGSGAIDIPGLRTPGKTPRIQVKYYAPATHELIESWLTLRETWAQVLHKLAEQFAAGDFKFDPSNPDSARGQFAVLSRVYDMDSQSLWGIGEEES